MGTLTDLMASGQVNGAKPPGSWLVLPGGIKAASGGNPGDPMDYESCERVRRAGDLRDGYLAAQRAF